MLEFLSKQDWLTLIAIVIAPLLAVHIQRRLDIAREVRARRRWVFETLMATRQAKASPEHVRALNMIDIEFCTRTWRGTVVRKGVDEKIGLAWKAYRDHLNARAGESHDAIDRWLERGESLFIEMLFSMSRSLGYTFDPIDLKRGVYTPQAHGDLEADQFQIRKSLVQILSGQKNVPVQINCAEGQEKDFDRSRKLQQALIEVAKGEKEIRVAMSSSSACQSGQPSH